MSTKVGELRLESGTIEVWRPLQVTATLAARGVPVVGTRDVTPDAIAQALWEGYVEAGICAAADDDERLVAWSLAEHETLHLFLGERLWAAGSRVMHMLSGDGNEQPYSLRLFEESLVMSFARFLNTGSIETPLTFYTAKAKRWALEYSRYRPQVGRLVEAAIRSDT